MQFAHHISELVDGLGLKPLPLSKRGVGRDQIPVIVQRATRGDDNEELRRALAAMVEKLL